MYEIMRKYLFVCGKNCNLENLFLCMNINVYSIKKNFSIDLLLCVNVNVKIMKF